MIIKVTTLGLWWGGWRQWGWGGGEWGGRGVWCDISHQSRTPQGSDMNLGCSACSWEWAWGQILNLFFLYNRPRVVWSRFVTGCCPSVRLTVEGSSLSSLLCSATTVNQLPFSSMKGFSIFQWTLHHYCWNPYCKMEKVEKLEVLTFFIAVQKWRKQRVVIQASLLLNTMWSSLDLTLWVCPSWRWGRNVKRKPQVIMRPAIPHQAAARLMNPSLISMRMNWFIG